MSSPNNLQDLFDTQDSRAFVSHTAESRARIGKAQSGKTVSAETRARFAAARMGHEVRADTREKLRQANLGKTISAETRAKTSATLTGRPKPPGYGAKISAGKTRPIQTPVGVFASRILFHNWLLEQGVRDVHCKISLWLKTHADQVYYVAKNPQNQP
jgi:hypothetical protein